MEDVVEIAKDFSRLNLRRGIIHSEIEKVLSKYPERFSPGESEHLSTFDLQTRSFYTFFGHLYYWYIGGENIEEATHFPTLHKGNPILAVTFEPGRKKRYSEKFRETDMYYDEMKEEMDGHPGGKRWLPAPSFADLPKEVGEKTFADSFVREVPFYLGHVLANGVRIAAQKPEEDYREFVDEIFREIEILQPFAYRNGKYIRAILERNSAVA